MPGAGTSRVRVSLAGKQELWLLPYARTLYHWSGRSVKEGHGNGEAHDESDDEGDERLEAVDIAILERRHAFNFHRMR
jgi:hypothetical protein